ncbi:MAG: TonB-dependent receptor plug domain-containing protein, partial [Alteromonas macleodii]|nr:TonB-dependent receptor plug domain-containing protein [Alteromonas macleodii]
EATGLTETNMILNQLLPSFNFPQPSITDGTDHVRPAQLRGLAPDHTLVLVNGKRRHTSALLNLNGSVGRGSSAVDLNAIPANAIKRIEVLRDGAAAQYGSDAIAGVINIVLKDAAEGGEVSATYGANVTTMDGVPNLEGVSVGADGNLAFAEGSDRDVTDGQTFTLRGNVGFEWGDDGFVNVSGEYRDRGQANRSDYDQRENYARDTDGNLDPRELTVNRYNHVYGNGEVEDYALFINAGKALTDSVEFYTTAGYSTRDSVGGGFYRRAQDSRNVVEIYPDGFLPSIQTDITDMSLLAGIKGYGDVWNYDLSVTHGGNELEYGVINTLNTSLGPTSQTEFDAGTLEYNTTIVNADASRLV